MDRTLERPFVAIVDDDFGVLRSIERLLTAHGFGVKTYSSGQSLLNDIEDRRPLVTAGRRHYPDAGRKLRWSETPKERRALGKRVGTTRRPLPQPR